MLWATAAFPPGVVRPSSIINVSATICDVAVYFEMVCSGLPTGAAGVCYPFGKRVLKAICSREDRHIAPSSKRKRTGYATVAFGPFAVKVILNCSIILFQVSQKHMTQRREMGDHY